MRTRPWWPWCTGAMLSTAFVVPLHRLGLVIKDWPKGALIINVRSATGRYGPPFFSMQSALESVFFRLWWMLLLLPRLLSPLLFCVY